MRNEKKAQPMSASTRLGHSNNKMGATPVSQTWSASVTRGRKLVGQIGRSKWELGDLANEVCPAVPSVHTGGTLEQFAAEIGLTHSALREYRQVAKAWPASARAEAQTWTTHRELAEHEDRYRIIAEQQWTYNALSERLGRLPQPSRSTPDGGPRPEPAEDELLAQIRTGIRSNPTLARAARKALDEQWHERYENNTVLVSQHPHAQPVELVYEFRRLHRSVDSIIALVIEGKAIVSDSEREAVLREVQWLRTALGYIEDGVAANSLDKALAQMLSAEA